MDDLNNRCLSNNVRDYNLLYSSLWISSPKLDYVLLYYDLIVSDNSTVDSRNRLYNE